ncbi:gephyrin-like molybdotransferase Glp [Kytococcus schroeteri]|nr:gephyrin-like molybdotransferase Glp [Kytococcus schroeteri]
MTTTRREVLTVEEYRAEVLALLPGPTGPEEVAVPDAAGRVLAEPARAAGAVPPLANSAMDGIAVRGADLGPLLGAGQGEDGAGVVLVVVGEVPAGCPDDPAVGPGECVRIMTGAPVPTDTDTVVPVEQLERVSGPTERVRVVSAPRGGVGAHVRHAGEDLAAGDEVLPAGTLLTPGALGALAGAGVATVCVRRRPVVGVVATGDELVPAGRPLGRGQVHESNAVHLAALAAGAGAEVVTGPVVPDDAESFAARLDELATRCDLLLLSGGVSVGDHDVTRIVLGDGSAQAGARGVAGRFVHVRMQPGKPQGHAVWAGTPLVAVPGNPLSAAVSFEMFVRPAVRVLLGLPDPVPQVAVAGADWDCPPGRRQVLPVVTSTDATGRRVAVPAHRRGSASHMVTALALADAVVEVPEDTTHVTAGDLLTLRSIR